MNGLERISGVGDAPVAGGINADMFAGGGSMGATDYLGVKQAVFAHGQMSALEVALHNVEKDRTDQVIKSMT